LLKKAIVKVYLAKGVKRGVWDLNPRIPETEGTIKVPIWTPVGDGKL
jgi:hypothetical protein